MVSNILAVQTRSFKSGANNYHSTQKKFANKEAVSKKALKQKRFHEHYCSGRHRRLGITLMASANTLKELRGKELHWMHN